MRGADEGKDAIPTPDQTDPQIYEHVNFSGGIRVGKLEVRGRTIDGDKVVYEQPAVSAPEARPQAREVITSVASPYIAPASAERDTPPTEEIVWDERGEALARKAAAEAADLTKVFEKSKYVTSGTREDERRLLQAKETVDKAGLTNALASTGPKVALTRTRKSLPAALDGVASNDAVFEKAVPMFLAECASTGSSEAEAKELVFRVMCEVASVQQARTETTDVRARATQLYAEALRGGVLPDMTEALTNFKTELETRGRLLMQVLVDMQPYLAKIEDQERRYPDSLRTPTRDEILGMLRPSHK